MLSKDIIKLEAAESTNDFAREITRGGEPVSDVTIILARDQQKGRGQGGNTWESAPGENLTFSAIIKPAGLEARDQFYLSMAVSLAVADFIEGRTGSVAVKWPNDIYVNDRKICGILIENDIAGSHISSSIIGIGVNINQARFSPGIPNPTSLRLETGVDHELDEALNGITGCLCSRLDLLYAGMYADMKQQYIARMYRFGTEARFRDRDGVFGGVIRDVSDGGLLTVEHSASGVYRTYAFKEVEYII